MLITDKEALRAYASDKRLWQGIPAIEVTRGGRIFVAFYSGGQTEEAGNFSVLLVSRDGGKSFSEPICAVDVGKVQRAYDSALWIDPRGRLWYIWSVMPNNRIEYAICDDPDADTLVWSDIRLIPGDVMLNKPIVRSDGAWLFPSAVWAYGKTTGSAGGSEGDKETGAHVYATYDGGESFEKLGTVVAENRSFDEHMLLEKRDGSIEMYVRTTYGIAKSVSRDGGASFGEDTDSGFGGPCSRFYIGRLASGNILLVNHYKFNKRNNLCAMISRDDGKTFEGHLRIDERKNVSYPDVKEMDGRIYIVYDRERGAHYIEGKDYTDSAREILMAVLTEEDILAGRTVSDESQLKMIVSKV